MSAKRDDGGPAFPVSSENSTAIDHKGMTLRDYFIAHAPELPQVIHGAIEAAAVDQASREGKPIDGPRFAQLYAEAVATFRVQYADAQVAARTAIAKAEGRA